MFQGKFIDADIYLPFFCTKCKEFPYLRMEQFLWKHSASAPVACRPYVVESSVQSFKFIQELGCLGLSSRLTILNIRALAHASL